MTFNTLSKKSLDTCRSLANRATTKVAMGTAVALTAIGTAQAQESAEAAFTAVQAEGSAMAGYAWPVVASITAALIGIKLFKKFANRAS